MEEKLAKTAAALGIDKELSLAVAMDKREEEIKGLKDAGKFDEYLKSIVLDEAGKKLQEATEAEDKAAVEELQNKLKAQKAK